MSDKAENQLPESSPDSLPFFVAGALSPSPLSASDMNRIVSAIRPLQRMEGRGGIKITRSDSNVIIELSKEALRRLQINESDGNSRNEFFHPFKIYQVPASKCSNPDNAWRTFAVCSGQAHIYPLTMPDGSLGSCTIGTDANIEEVSYLTETFVKESDFGNPPANDIAVPSSGNADPTSPGMFVLDENPDESGEGYKIWGAYFWIELHEISGDDYATLRVNCCMMGYDGRPGFSSSNNRPYRFPTGGDDGAGGWKTILPIGYVKWLGDKNSLYDAGVVNFSVQEIIQLRHDGEYQRQWNTRHRGDWDSDSLSGRYFIDGDIVTKDSGKFVKHYNDSGGYLGQESVYHVYRHVGEAIETDPPNYTDAVITRTPWALIS